MTSPPAAGSTCSAAGSAPRPAVGTAAASAGATQQTAPSVATCHGPEPQCHQTHSPMASSNLVSEQIGCWISR